jgi:uncharacterized protein YbjT (DUF2867 family)
MHIITGASGQVGSAVAANLIKKGESVKGIIRNEKKAGKLKEQGASVGIADIHDPEALAGACRDGHTFFAITPETGKEKDVLGDMAIVLDNYRKAVEGSSIKRIVGLSSMGAQFTEKSGNLLMSHMLEQAFKGLDVQQSFIRPAYYFSNWLLYLPVIKEQKILPTFFPPDLSIPMASPMDVADLAATVLLGKDEKIYELEGPATYSSDDVAAAFSEALGIPVKTQQILREQWDSTLADAGFSPDGIKNFIEMTETVVDGRAKPEGTHTTVTGKTTLQEFIRKAVA